MVAEVVATLAGLPAARFTGADDLVFGNPVGGHAALEAAASLYAALERAGLRRSLP